MRNDILDTKFEKQISIRS